ncbi:MAG TPA: YceI family protein [Anaeromyxobacteraceae bacterium]
MKKTLATLLLALPVLALAAPATWDVDSAHTSSAFAVRHLVISTVRGEFGKTAGAVTFDDKDVSKSTVDATIDATTIDTREPKRDEHLRSPDFFDTAKYPTITFKSTQVEKAGEGKLKVTGHLTLHGVTKPVVLDVAGPTAEVKDPWGNVRRGFSATARINRQDFGLAFSKTIEAGPVVGDEVTISLDGELIKKADPKTAAK